MIKYVFVDMDNTIAENKTCDNVKFSRGLYLTKRPIKIVINAIINLYKDKSIFIMSKYVGEEEGKKEKIQWLKKYTPKDFWKNSPFLIKADDGFKKSEYILCWAISNNINLKECLIIDDNKNTLQECKKQNINVLYPQQVICEYEQFILEGENNACFK